MLLEIVLVEKNPSSFWIGVHANYWIQINILARLDCNVKKPRFHQWFLHRKTTGRMHQKSLDSTQQMLSFSDSDRNSEKFSLYYAGAMVKYFYSYIPRKMASQCYMLMLTSRGSLKSSYLSCWNTYIWQKYDTTVRVTFQLFDNFFNMRLSLASKYYASPSAITFQPPFSWDLRRRLKSGKLGSRIYEISL